LRDNIIIVSAKGALPAILANALPLADRFAHAWTFAGHRGFTLAGRFSLLFAVAARARRLPQMEK